MNFIFIDERVLLAGVVARDLPAPSQAAKKRRRSERASLTTQLAIERAVAQARLKSQAAEASFEAEKKRIITEFVTSERYKTEILGELRPLLEQGLNQSHDFVAY